MARMILEKAFIVIFSVTLVSAIPPHLRDLRDRPKGNFEKEKQENNKQNNLPLAFSDYYDYWNYDYDNYDYLEAWYDCDGDMCVDNHDWLGVDRKIEVDNSSLELTASEYFDVNATTLWEECAPSVPLSGRLVKFKSCRDWAEENDGIFNSYYSNNVCNFRKRMWLGQDGEIDGGKIAEMFKELEGFGEYLESCIQWDGEWPDYYDYDYDYYDYDYRDGDVEKGANNKSNKEKSEKKGSRTKTKKRTEKKKKHHFGKKNKNNGKRKNGDRNGNAINGKNENKKRKKNKNKNKQMKHKKNKGRRRKGKKAKKPNTKHNGIRYKREAAKYKKGKKNNNKKKKKQRQQKKALKLIELATLPTEQTVERLMCIEISVSSKLNQCGENILKDGLSPKHIGK